MTSGVQETQVVNDHDADVRQQCRSHMNGIESAQYRRPETSGKGDDVRVDWPLQNAGKRRHGPLLHHGVVTACQTSAERAAHLYPCQ